MPGLDCDKIEVIVLEIIKLKGTGDGVKIYLDETAQFSEIITLLKNKLENLGFEITNYVEKES